jgi:AraC family transcriptional regulator
MASSIQCAGFPSTQNLDGQRLILSNATLHERGVTLGTYSNRPGEGIQPSDQYVRLVQIGAYPARAERRTGGRSIAFVKNPRSLTFVPPGFLPDVRLHTVSKLTFCQINVKVINELVGEMDRQPSNPLSFKSGISNRAITKILALMTEEFHAGAQLGPLYTETLAHALAIRLLHLDCASERTDTSTISALPSNKLNRIKDLIESGLDKDLSLKALASESGYSRAHFLRMFHASTGTTPHRYVLERRIDHAQRLLREKRTSLDNIAAACGFSSQTHMADVFRRTLNTTPKEYRRKS